MTLVAAVFFAVCISIAIAGVLIAGKYHYSAAVAEPASGCHDNDMTQRRVYRQELRQNATLKPFDAHCCHMVGAIKYSVPGLVKPSFVIFDIRALWRSGLSIRSECSDVRNYKWLFNPVWHRILYSCTHMATVGVKGLKVTVKWVNMICVFYRTFACEAVQSAIRQSVCPSLSHTLQYCVKTAKSIVEIL